MRILNISAQRPDNTGSGVYMTALIRAFEKNGHQCASIAGCNAGDEVDVPDGTAFYPVTFGTEELPFHVFGMSDVMPYDSSRYCDMTDEMKDRFQDAFRRAVTMAVTEFEPDIILCHHLYLMTATVRDLLPEAMIGAVCHSTDLRQFAKNDLEREFITENMRKLDAVFSLHAGQQRMIIDTYGINEDRIHIVGAGYDPEIFYREQPRDAPESGPPRTTKLCFAGKVTRDKGIYSLLNALHIIGRTDVELYLAGGTDRPDEYEDIRALAGEASCKVVMTGRIQPKDLAALFRKSDIFVLPSFYEGLPLTMIEAAACGSRVVCSDWPGVRESVSEIVPDALIRYVDLPALGSDFQPDVDELPAFEKRLADAIEDEICRLGDGMIQADMGAFSWDAIASRIMINGIG